MIFEMKQVIKRYKDRLALDYLNIEGTEGQIIGLLGPNGAGKTTAIKALVGLVDIDEGDIFVFGRKQTGKDKIIKSQIGYVTQEITLYENMTALDNLRFFGSLYGLDRDAIDVRIEEVSKIIGLENRLNEKVSKFSGGMKRRLNIGCSILHHPKLLIMDEPTVGVDPQSRNHILEFVREIAIKEKTTIIYTSHYIEEVQAISDYIYIMDLGHIIAKGTLQDLISKLEGDAHILIDVKMPSNELVLELKQNPDIKEVVLTKNQYHIVYPLGINLIEKIILKLSPCGILNIESKHHTLEDVFLTLTGKELRDGEKR